MDTVAEVRRIGACLVLIVLAAACGSAPSGSATVTPPASVRVEASDSPSISSPLEATASPGRPSPLQVPDPQRAYTAETILDAMRTSRRPGGVPDRLESEAVATAVAGVIWAYGGEPWTSMAIGGSCGSQRCTLEVAGTRSGTLGEDLWVLEINPDTQAVTVTEANLRSVPLEIVDPLDRLARALVGAERLRDLALSSVRWLPPPDDGTFVLSYRSGGEEGSCGHEVTLDAAAPAILADVAQDC